MLLPLRQLFASALAIFLSFVRHFAACFTQRQRRYARCCAARELTVHAYFSSPPPVAMALPICYAFIHRGDVHAGMLFFIFRATVFTVLILPPFYTRF